MLNKLGWINIHGIYPHHEKFKDLRWKWTPKICKCIPACMLNTKEKA